ncbi:MAG: hypothetical protein Q9179_000487 [Wetmoreana sp. 5 TL-2023]
MLSETTEVQKGPRSIVRILGYFYLDLSKEYGGDYVKFDDHKWYRSVDTLFYLIPMWVGGAAEDNDFAPLLLSWAYGGGRPGGEVAEKKDEDEIAIQSKRGNTIKRNASPDNPAVHVTRPGNDVVKRQSELDVEEKKNAGEGGDDNEQQDQTYGGDNKDATDPAVAEEDAVEEKEKNEGRLSVPETNGQQQKEKSKSPAPKSKSPARKKSHAPKASPASKKRKAEEEPESDAPAAAAEPATKKARGRPKGSGAGAKTKETAAAAAPAKEKKTPGRKASAAATKKDDNAAKEAPATDEPAKKRGRPKGSGNGGKSAAVAKKEKKAPAKAVNGTVGSRTRSTKKK